MQEEKTKASTTEVGINSKINSVTSMASNTEKAKNKTKGENEGGTSTTEIG